MKKFPVIYLAVLTAILCCGLGISHAYAARQLEHPAGKAADFLFRPVQSIFAKATTHITDFWDSFLHAKHYRNENRQLRETALQAEKEERANMSLLAENQRLKKLLHMVERQEQWDTVACRVLSYDTGGVFHTLQIDGGAQKNICVNDIAVLSEGLVGKVTAVYPGSATVTTILQPGNAVGTQIVRNQCLGVAESTPEGMLRFAYFAEENAPIPEDVVETSGMGGVYPAGFLVGTVGTLKEHTDHTLYAEITPAVDFSQVRELLILRMQERSRP